MNDDCIMGCFNVNYNITVIRWECAAPCFCSCLVSRLSLAEDVHRLAYHQSTLVDIEVFGVQQK